MTKKVLIFEDEPDILGVVTIILENEGYKVVGSLTADDYKYRVNETHADLVLLDLNIGGFNGKAICDYMKHDRELKNTPIVLMSANINIAQVKKECGADDMIKKPFDLFNLINIVKAYA